jgi:hypothetical protein
LFCAGPAPPGPSIAAAMGRNRDRDSAFHEHRRPRRSKVDGKEDRVEADRVQPTLRAGPRPATWHYRRKTS